MIHLTGSVPHVRILSGGVVSHRESEAGMLTQRMTPNLSMDRLSYDGQMKH